MKILFIFLNLRGFRLCKYGAVNFIELKEWNFITCAGIKFEYIRNALNINYSLHSHIPQNQVNNVHKYTHLYFDVDIMVSITSVADSLHAFPWQTDDGVWGSAWHYLEMQYTIKLITYISRYIILLLISTIKVSPNLFV